ncbi:serine/threonine-protein kinase [Actinotalea sp. AC32]|nr:serine/threonine-protein kinase [Actinotalea sp. AC32]
MERIGVAPGTEVGGYRVLSPLGRGGMGAVYRAVDGDGVAVALKLLHPHLAADPSARERLRREVAHLQRIRHENVARVLDAEIEADEAFVVTELVDGEDLATRVRERGPLPPAAVVDLGERLRGALEVVHAAGVLHRDLTPGNVVMSPRGPVLIDFGIAQAADDARVTSTGMVVGTPGYLSPELLEGAEAGPEADWWGWAAVLAFAATGRPPFGAAPVQAVVARVRTGEVDLAGLDPRTAAVLRSALTVDPARRADPEQVLTRLREAPDEATAVLTATDGPTTVLPSAPVADHPADDVARTAIVTAADPWAPGSTRVLPWHGDTGPGGEDDRVGSGEGPHDDADDDAYDGAYDDGAYDDGADDDGADDDEPYDQADDGVDADGTGPSEEDWSAPRPRRRAGSVLALGAVLVALGAARPALALLVAVAVAVVARTVAVAREAHHARRRRRGVRRGDAARTAVAAPWHLVRGLVGVVPSVLVALSTVVVVGGVAWWLLGTGRVVVQPPGPGEAAGALTTQAAWVTPALLAGVVTVGLLVLWFGPTARTTRTGARVLLATVAPGVAGAVSVVLLALAVAVVVVLTVSGGPVDWWPLGGPPDLR